MSEAREPAPRLDVISGWGRATAGASRVVEPADCAAVGALLAQVGPRGALARGLGRSYGDAATNSGGVVMATRHLGRLDLDPERATLRVGAGVSIHSILETIVPAGWFVPVTPGTRQVTVGGAIAADIHGKNHHVAGSFGEHIGSLTLVSPGRGLETLTPGARPREFWATVGGMGLTGVVVGAEIDVVAIPSSWLVSRTERAADLDGVMDAVAAAEAAQPYVVAWIDCTRAGPGLGRGLVTSGRFAEPDELDGRSRYRGPEATTLRAPAAPAGLLSAASVRAFNRAWFQRIPRRGRTELASIGAFFHPLDRIEGWNRLYGPRGFVQWQVVVPLGAEATLRVCVERLAAAGLPSFLAVLKRFRDANPGPLSFPLRGWTLALDIPVGAENLASVLDELDEAVAGAGGRVYLAKDGRLRPELVPAMYPRLDEWREVRAELDPERTLCSDLDRRLQLSGPR